MKMYLFVSAGALLGEIKHDVKRKEMRTLRQQQNISISIWNKKKKQHTTKYKVRLT